MDSYAGSNITSMEITIFLLRTCSGLQAYNDVLVNDVLGKNSLVSPTKEVYRDPRGLSKVSFPGTFLKRPFIYYLLLGL